MIAKDGHVAGLRLVQTRRNASGALEFIEGSEFLEPFDMILKAVGQQKQDDWLKKVFPELTLNRNGTVARDFATGQTNLPNIFTGGDCANGGREVVNAVGEESRARNSQTFLRQPSARASSAFALGRFDGTVWIRVGTAPIAFPNWKRNTSSSRPRRIPELQRAPSLPRTRSSRTMADLFSTNLAGIKSPNPFWIASGPPGNTAYQAHRAFEAGWGGVVWKTIGDPIRQRFLALFLDRLRQPADGRLNNIELISDRSPETNFREIAEVKKRWPNHAVIASLMVDTREHWHDFVKRSADCGADGIELNFGCPHGMCERGMGSAVGQNPDVAATSSAGRWRSRPSP